MTDMLKYVIATVGIIVAVVGGKVHNTFFPTQQAASQQTITQSSNTVTPDSRAATSQKHTPDAPVKPTPPPVVKLPPVTAPVTDTYPLHKNITATVFWVGEPVGNGSSENNAISAWDDTWEADYGGFDDYSYIRTVANNYFPTAFVPKENPFYLDLPYNDFTDSGSRQSNAMQVVPWASSQTWTSNQSMMKNRWVKIIRNGTTCYGQIEDAGPYVYNDYTYVFGTTDARPQSKEANNAGMDVSPALRDCLKFAGLNNADNQVSWQFVEASDVPQGPWKAVVTASQINWP